MQSESDKPSGLGLDRQDAERRILRYVALGEARCTATLYGPVFTVDRLAERLGLDFDICRRALYALTQRGELEVDVLSATLFTLRPGPRRSRPHPWNDG